MIHTIQLGVRSAKALDFWASRLSSHGYEPERAGDVKHSLADMSLAEKHLGYKPKVDFEEGLRRTIEWYRSREKTAKA